MCRAPRAGTSCCLAGGLARRCTRFRLERRICVTRGGAGAQKENGAQRLASKPAKRARVQRLREDIVSRARAGATPSKNADVTRMSLDVPECHTCDIARFVRKV